MNVQFRVYHSLSQRTLETIQGSYSVRRTRVASISRHEYVQAVLMPAGDQSMKPSGYRWRGHETMAVTALFLIGQMH
ncbi:hypothetical protein PM082_020430 [Marasmius tenuissimus]|nr:hypothetical protein PM082_020430 [Marasmius tenuissimus]